MNFSKSMCATALSATLIVAAACAGTGNATPQVTSGQSSSPPSVASSPPPTAPTPSAGVDWSELDACTLLDEQTVRELTGSSLNFTTDGRGGDCFYGATTPVPQYVDISVFARPDGLSGYTFNPDDCSRDPVMGVGAEAFGGTCVISTQDKVYVVAWDRGVAIRVLVNEPLRDLTPEDIGATATRILQEIL